jgi:hypothetical protein
MDHTCERLPQLESTFLKLSRSFISSINLMFNKSILDLESSNVIIGSLESILVENQQVTNHGMYHVIQILFICGNMEYGMLYNPL